MKFFVTIFCILNLSILNSAFAWGPTGHRVVGEVAQKYLTLLTKIKIKKLTNGHSLAQFATWPDEIKSDPDKYSHTYHWHYTDWPNGQDKYSTKDNHGSLITSLEDNLKILKNKKLSNDERSKALKFVIHLMGDLHQPLHIGNGTDRGGNNCKVVFHKQLINLHRLWDADMINFTNLSYTELSNFVNVTSKSAVKEIKKGNVLSWAKETKNLRESIYPIDGQTTKQDNPKVPQVTGERRYCQKDNTLTETELPQLGYRYSYVFMPIVEKRLLYAGIRLAKVINDAL